MSLKRRMLFLFAAAVFVLLLCSPVFAAGHSFGDATAIGFNTTVSGSITEAEDEVLCERTVRREWLRVEVE